MSLIPTMLHQWAFYLGVKAVGQQYYKPLKSLVRRFRHKLEAPAR